MTKLFARLQSNGFFREHQKSLRKPQQLIAINFFNLSNHALIPAKRTVHKKAREINSRASTFGLFGLTLEDAFS
jgi:hypothetical protein